MSFRQLNDSASLVARSSQTTQGEDSIQYQLSTVRRLPVTITCLCVAVISTALELWRKVIIRQRVQIEEWWLLATTTSWLDGPSAALWELFEFLLDVTFDALQ
ncbi:hypothetical protein QBC43DRAFT_304832 [Cladorrhinum sp. PSN259]|nr:hypothetical protein QBC43DRAFT_304832 [Cladorrhinum sp. PSN259]